MQAGEALRIRCAQGTCGFVNVIPADPSLAPWEAHGSTKLLVVDDPEGAVLLAPPVTRARSHKLLIALCVFVALLGTLAVPSVRRPILLRWAIHEIRTTGSAHTAQFWCEWLKEAGVPSPSAAPLVWNLHFRKFEGGTVLKEPFINEVLDKIDPSYLAQARPHLTESTPTKDLIAALGFPEAETRRLSAVLLGSRGPAARDAVYPLISMAERSQDEARGNAVDALGTIGPGAAAAVEPLIKLLFASGTLRPKIAHALTEIAPRDNRVVSALNSAGISIPTTQPLERYP